MRKRHRQPHHQQQTEAKIGMDQPGAKTVESPFEIREDD
jgi:hypothetical protein